MVKRDLLFRDLLRERGKEGPKGHIAIGAIAHRDVGVRGQDEPMVVDLRGEGTERQIGLQDAQAQQYIAVLDRPHDRVRAQGPQIQPEP